jgi:hypothetical protein
VGIQEPGMIKTISELDDFLQEIRNDPKYTKYKFQLINKLDEWMNEFGLWVLADGGCHQYLTFLYAGGN